LTAANSDFDKKNGMIPSRKEQIFVVISEPQANYLLDRVMHQSGYDVTTFTEKATAEEALRALTPKTFPDLVLIADKLTDGNGLDLARSFLSKDPNLATVLVTNQDTPDLLKAALKSGISDAICLPLRTDEILKTVQNSIRTARERKEWMEREGRRDTSTLQQQVSELETLDRLGRSITATLDPDAVLSAIVGAAVELTGAEEGSLLLIDEPTGELYMRASRNFQEQFVRTFRIPVQDSLAGSVIRTGKPVLFDQDIPQKIKTAYLVQRLLYVPLQSHGHVFGVLGVDNRQKSTPFNEHHIQIASALADFAVIAIENARQNHNTVAERNKLETILTNIQDGIIVLDAEGRVVLINQTAQSAFNINQANSEGQLAADIFTHPDLLELIGSGQKTSADRGEINVSDGRVFSSQLTPIPEVGLAITMHDITSLKKLDRIKTDFVNTVSHDLRSPLTAILGYVELIDRVGTINDTQREFIRRVQTSVHNITDLVDDLLNLGRIEAGFDTRKEMVQIDQIIRISTQECLARAVEKDLKLITDLQEQFPPLFGNPIQIRQMIDNLLDNAIKYTPNGGVVKITAKVEGRQIILQVIDTGMGIPLVDLPFIFDKFYRASNINTIQNGTGLGLSIVKSIVENHMGRIWVDSVLDQGTKFTIILPLLEAETT
jgi:two-component system phosphate regulon sensor histidine kinase PhoR